MVLKFHPVGRELVVPLFDEEKPDTIDEQELAEWAARSDVQIKIKLVGRALFRHWAYESDRIRADGRARVRLLRKLKTEEEHPRLYTQDYLDEETAAELDAFMKDVVHEAVLKLEGIDVEGVEPSGYSDPTTIAEVLEQSGLLGVAFARVFHFQNPERKDVFC